ncbi:MAG: regulatory protein RecX [Bacteroidales bacterium]|nr:regulatory protein RecX [Bacteroidales bacterium]
MNKNNYTIALERAMSLCSKSEKCRNDIGARLNEWKLTNKQENEDIINELVKNNFIDEKRYAGAYSRDKIRFNKWGKVKIRLMLKSRGIGEEDIEHGLGLIDDESYLGMIEEEIKEKKRTIRAKNLFDLKARLIRFASSRGYEQDYVYDIINRLKS